MCITLLSNDTLEHDLYITIYSYKESAKFERFFLCIECIGFYGINCGHPCVKGFYGEGCKSYCNCSAIQTCNQFVGCIPSGYNIREITQLSCSYKKHLF